MKTILLTTLILLLLISFDLQERPTENPISDNNSIEQEMKIIPENKVPLIVYNGCYYIILKEDRDAHSTYGFMAYKGNCSNPSIELFSESAFLRLNSIFANQLVLGDDKNIN